MTDREEKVVAAAAQMKLSGEFTGAEEMAQAIQNINHAVNGMKAAGLNERAIIVLLHESSGVGKTMIKKVLYALEHIAEDFTNFSLK